MKKIKPLPYTDLCQKLTHDALNFITTKDITSFTKFIGQERAWEALNFGIGMRNPGFNLYAMGPSGIGKRSLISTALHEYARNSCVPEDWCYIYNFTTPEKPIAISMPAGYGMLLQQDMKLFINEVSTNILVVLESKEYSINLKKINQFLRKNG